MHRALACILLLVLTVPAAAAETFDIRIVETDNQQIWQFEPRDLEIQVGDTVRWTDEAPGGHTTTSRDGLFDHAFSEAQIFSYRFDEAGSFQYFCKPHDWMSGTIAVAEAPGDDGTDPGDGGSEPGDGSDGGSSGGDGGDGTQDHDEHDDEKGIPVGLLPSLLAVDLAMRLRRR